MYINIHRNRKMLLYHKNLRLVLHTGCAKHEYKILRQVVYLVLQRVI